MTKKKYKNKKTWLGITEWAGFPISMGILIGLRFKTWFQVSETSAEASRVRVQIGIGFVMALIVFVLVIMKKTNFLKGIWGWILALGITYYLRTIINELWLILLALTIAELLYTIINPYYEDACKQYELVKDTTIQEQVKHDITEEYSGRV